MKTIRNAVTILKIIRVYFLLIFSDEKKLRRMKYGYFKSIKSNVNEHSKDLFEFGLTLFNNVDEVRREIRENRAQKKQNYFSAKTRDQFLGKSVLLPPGVFLQRVARFIFSQKTVDEIFDPIISDLQLEYFESLDSSQPFKAEWVVLRGRIAFFEALLAFFPIAISRRVFKIWKSMGTE